MADSDLASFVRAAWWLLLARGVLTILFGLVALLMPATAVLGLVVVFAVYAILDGGMAVGLGVRHRKAEAHWKWQVFQGVISLLAGIAALAWPGVTVFVALTLIAAWSVVNGVAGVVESLSMRKAGAQAWGWTLAGGVINVLFGIALLAWPGAGLLTLLWLVGFFAVVFGAVVVAWAFKLRGVAREVGAARATDTPPVASA
jgi:uncharacterized membrane protein HdeD (DUF308 family)